MEWCADDVVCGNGGRGGLVVVFAWWWCLCGGGGGVLGGVCRGKCGEQCGGGLYWWGVIVEEYSVVMWEWGRLSVWVR